MKIDAQTPAAVPSIARDLIAPQPPAGTLPRTPGDIFFPPRPPGPVFPPNLEDSLYEFGLGRKGSEDLATEKLAQQVRAQQALRQSPPDLQTYFDAQKKIDAIEGEQGQRAIEQRGYELGLRFKSDDALEAELDSATEQLQAVMDDPKASEADREKARARLQAVVEELERRD